MSIAAVACIRAYALLFRGSELCVLYALASRMGSCGECFPSGEQLGQDAGMSGRNAARIVKALKAMEVLRVTHGDRKGRRSNHYRLNTSLLGGLGCRLREEGVDSKRLYGIEKAAAIRERARTLRAELEARARKQDTCVIVANAAQMLQMSRSVTTKPRPAEADTALSDERKGNKTETEIGADDQSSPIDQPIIILAPFAKALGVSAYELSKTASTASEAKALVARWKNGTLAEGEIDQMIAGVALKTTAERGR